MSFAQKLKGLMEELGLTQTKLSELTGIGKPSISQYLSGRNEPTAERKKKMARTLGVPEDYFGIFPDLEEVQQEEVVNVPVTLAAKLMGKSIGWVTQGLQDGVFPWGYAVKMGKWSYFISSVKFTEYTGIPVPLKRVEEG